MKHGYTNYTPENARKAIEMVKIKGMSVYKSSIICGVPTQTLRDRIKGKIDEKIEKSGPSPILSNE